MNAIRTKPLRERSLFGVFLTLRAIPAGAVAIAITFSANHAIIVGQISFVAFGLVSAPVLLLTSVASGFPRNLRLLFLLEAVVTLLSAAFMAVTVGSGLNESSDALRIFTLTVGVWAAISCLAEFLSSRFSARSDESREMLLVAVLLALLALSQLLLPLNDVFAVGLFGAFAAILCVLTAIAGFTLITSTNPRPQKAEQA